MVYFCSKTLLMLTRDKLLHKLYKVNSLNNNMQKFASHIVRIKENVNKYIKYDNFKRK